MNVGKRDSGVREEDLSILTQYVWALKDNKHLIVNIIHRVLNLRMCFMATGLQLWTDKLKKLC